MKKTVAPLQDTQEKKQNKNGVGKKIIKRKTKIIRLGGL